MTSILAIQANEEDNEAIILAADTQITLYEGPSSTGKDPYPPSKIREIKNFAAIAMCGEYDKYVEAFFGYLVDHGDYRKFLGTLTDIRPIPELDNQSNQFRYLKRDVRKRLKDLLEGKAEPPSDLEKLVVLVAQNKIQVKSSLDAYLVNILNNMVHPVDPLTEALSTTVLSEVADLNRHFTRRNQEKGEEIVLEDYPEFLIATNAPLALFKVNSYGGIKKLPADSGDIDYCSMGSGSKYLDQYLKQGTYRNDPDLNEYFPEFQDHFSIDNISSRVAFELAYAAMMFATKRDEHSGGIIEIVTLKLDTIIPHKVIIKRAIIEAEKTAVRTEAAQLSY